MSIKRRGALAPGIKRALQTMFRDAGLARRWWKGLAKEIRRCLRCGGKLRWRHVAAEGRRRFVCAGCRFIVYQNPKIVAATLPVWRGKVILLRRAIEPALGCWSHPAGFMELGETVEDAAARETLEEIRCRVKLTGPPAIYSYEDAGVVTVVYPARVVGRGPRRGAEALEVRAFRPADIPWRELAFRSTYHALRDWMESRSSKR